VDIANRNSALPYFLAWLLAWAASPFALADNACLEHCDTQIWVSPLQPKAGAPVKIMAVSTDAPISELELLDHQGQRTALPGRRRGGPPWSLMSGLEGLDAGDYQVEAGRKGKKVACHPLRIGKVGAPARPYDWEIATEAFYSAWIETLFSAPLDENFSFPSLEPVLGDNNRNFLHHYLGLNEDHHLPLTPDCADLPYTLRAYFAWKLGLPFAFRACNRGSAKAPPRCGAATVTTEFTGGIQPAKVFKKRYRQLADTVHSGSARTGLEDEATDLYPVPLSRETLWPGTVYADPYGHVLVLVEWVPQTMARPGLLLAVDAQPDHSVSRKRFWEGTFLFANTASAGPGFKAFRPLNRATGNLRLLGNEALVDHPGFADFSPEQDSLSPDEFYARLAKLINPHGLGPKQAYEATLAALIEQIETRVDSVDNGEAYFREHPGSVIAMPSGAAIFQTLGPWEDYSTPSRDFRLIIAINVLESLPERIVRHPELFMLDDLNPEQAKAGIERLHAQRIHQPAIRYTRTDGSQWPLSVAEVLARKSEFEMAYNPNDCPELRWGARPGSEEYATCHRHAPAGQRAKMQQYRSWFRESRRPIP